MNDMSWFTVASTVIAALVIALGTMFPAIAMGRAISHALDALARQPEAVAMIESLAIYCLVVVLIILFRNPLIAYLIHH